MTDFWLLSLALTVLALGFIFVPVYRYIKAEGVLDDEVVSESGGGLIDASQVERQRQNVLIFKERMAELEAEYEQGKHKEEDYLQLLSELEGNLLIDAEAATGNDESRGETGTIAPILNAKNLVVICFSAVLVVAISYGSYFKYGAYDAVIQTKSMQFDDREIKQARVSAEQGDVSALLEQLYHKLQQAPDNIEGWRLLARSAMSSEKFDLAIEAYTQIIRIFDATDESTAAVYGLLAQANYYQNQGQMNAAAQLAMEQALEQNPNEVNSLGLMAINAFVQQEYSVAIENWEKILIAAPGHPSKVSIEAGIQRAKAALGEEVVVQDELVAGSGARIRVEVSVASEVYAQVSPKDTVFIFAKAPEGKGPAMPLAARKLQVSDLPITVELSDQSAMGPMAKLSQVKIANIVARISRSGQPIAQPGDFEGVYNEVSVFDNQSVKVEISTQK